MPSAEAESDEAQTESNGSLDEGRTALLEALIDELGDALVETHLDPGRNLWVRVTNESWSATADYLRNRQRFRFFDWLSAIDWMQSPYGRSHDAEVDKALAGDDNEAVAATQDGGTEAGGAAEDDSGFTGTGADGVTGGETRFQVIARVYNLTTKLGLNLKVDVGGDLTVGTWTNEYPGADWHEREAWEMYGITFEGHPGLRNLYLPGDFEGHPLRKDFPLLARLVKPWPGIVDVELMPPLPSVANEVPPAAELPEPLPSVANEVPPAAELPEPLPSVANEVPPAAEPPEPLPSVANEVPPAAEPPELLPSVAPEEGEQP